MTEPHLHPLAIVEVMLNFAQQRGLSAEHCLLGTGIEVDREDAEERLITREQELRLVENLVLAWPDAGVAGFELGLQYNMATFGAWGFAIRTSRTLKEAVRFALRYLPLSTAYCRVELDEREDPLALVFDGSEIPLITREFLVLRDMATALNLLRELSFSGSQVCGFELAFSGPAGFRSLVQKLGFSVRFNAGRNALFLAKADADKPLSTFDAHLTRILEDQCRLQLGRRRTVGLTGEVRALLLGPMGLVASLEDVAEALAMSVRSLRRRLDQEGTSFRQLVETERKQLAEQLLANSQMTLDELAIHLGYSDTASFTRAFRRWHGQSPGQFRRAVLPAAT